MRGDLDSVVLWNSFYPGRDILIRLVGCLCVATDIQIFSLYIFTPTIIILIIITIQRNSPESGYVLNTTQQTDFFLPIISIRRLCSKKDTAR